MYSNVLKIMSVIQAPALSAEVVPFVPGGRLDGDLKTMPVDYLPVFLMVAAVVFLALFILYVSSLVRPSNPYPEKNRPYECGVDEWGEASGGLFKVQFFVVAILFVVFDVEAMFLFPWAVVLKEMGMFAYIEMFVFIALLLVGYIYAWRKGALDWET